ncbi:MAG: hypothetical protein AAGG48_28765 [Planctomycetota bacterium]
MNCPKRFRIWHLFVVVLLSSIVFCIYSPFRPTLTLQVRSRENFIAYDDKQMTRLVVEVCNDGVLPVWYPGWEDMVTQYSMLVRQAPGRTPERVQSVVPIPDQPWIKLSSGDVTTLNLQFDDEAVVERIGIELIDWRDCKVMYWSKLEGSPRS